MVEGTSKRLNTEQPEKAVKGDLSDLSPLILGGAVFNTQYNDNPEEMAIEDILMHAFGKGINAIDTSPYYGTSEILLGNALQNLQDQSKIKRENYYILTKCGRIKLDDFDYSPEWIRKSILRSLDRMKTEYLDLIHLHDIEFVEEEGILAALRELKKLKDEGLIRNFGLSGYPVDFLYKMALRCVSDPEIGPLDSVLSYCNGCLQNTTLLQYYDRFIKDCQLKLMNNSSILSMSLLRSLETRSFHPGSQALKQRVSELAKMLQEKYDIELADLATRYAIKQWIGRQGVTLIGISNIVELDDALKSYWNVVDNKFPNDDAIFEESQNFLGPHLDETWASGIPH